MEGALFEGQFHLILALEVGVTVSETGPDEFGQGLLERVEKLRSHQALGDLACESGGVEVAELRLDLFELRPMRENSLDLFLWIWYAIFSLYILP